MFRDILVGKYYPVDSVIHRMDPRAKIIATGLYMALVFTARTYGGYLLVSFLFLLGVFSSRVPLKAVLSGLRPILFIVGFTFVVNLLFAHSGEVLLSWGILTISRGGVGMALTMACRLILLVLGTGLLTLTTSPIQLTEGLERVLLPLSLLRFPVHEMSMMMTIALRFIPDLAEDADRIRKAQAARGADFDTGGLLQRAKAMVPLLVPLFVGAFRRAGELATAMEARCYTGSEGRTRMHVLRLSPPDVVLLFLLTAALVLLLFFRL